MEVSLPEQVQLELEEGNTGIELARKIKKTLSGTPLALEINGVIRELTTPLTHGDKVRIITFHDPEGKELFWHSAAHLLAQAVLRLYPEALPTIGPPIETGFYYDFANLTLSETEFPAVEAEMKKIVSERLVPERIEYEIKGDALKEFENNPFKKEMIEGLGKGLSAYRQGDFIDLCRGPHIPHTGLIQSFKIMKTSGAYWRADASNEQLTRVYAVAYPDKKMLSAYLRFLEEAKKRDHRVLAKQLHLISFHTEAAGMPFFHPNGMIIWDELMRYWEECHQEAGYHKIKTPVMLSKELWKISGHWDNYRENMYISEIDSKEYAIKPMNCPGCMLYYKEGQYSYRQLPLRLAEIGNVHRHEMSGALSGLFRVRSFHQDDAHIFMKPEDISPEIRAVLDLAGKMYRQFDLEFHLELSTRPEKSIGSDEQWKMATEGLKKALEMGGFEYVINEGDGAFYGPKIDIHIKDAIGRTWQCGTIQLDMSLPERFDLSYIAEDGNKQRPIMIHRVIYGSIERFFGVLIEHYSGKFPMWLSPRHVRILAIAEMHHEYAQEVNRKFTHVGIRSEADISMESVNKKVRQAQLDQVNYILVVGDREVADGSITIRAANKVIGTYPVEEVIQSLLTEYQSRSSRQNRINPN